MLLDAHRRGVAAVRAAAPHALVGLTLSMAEWEALPGGDQALERLRDEWEDRYLDGTDGDDFIGVQAYTRLLVDGDGLAPYPPGTRTTQMGYEFRPQALAATLRRAAAVTGLPVLITENGVATIDDDERVEFVDGTLRRVADCLVDGLDVRGYCYWSLLDNFEWVLGYGPRFGLVAVDRGTQRRFVKPSARWLDSVARTHALPPETT